MLSYEYNQRMLHLKQLGELGVPLGQTLVAPYPSLLPLLDEARDPGFFNFTQS